LREQFRAHAHFERTAEFCELYDSPAFDAHAETLPISEFEPMLRQVFAGPSTLYKKCVGSRKWAGGSTQGLSRKQNLYCKLPYNSRQSVRLLLTFIANLTVYLSPL
jgi:hypothetical protein